MAKLHKQNDGSVPVTEMKDGDLAVIVNWLPSSCIDRIVQRHGEQLITIGEEFGSGWGKFFAEGAAHKVCRVRILQPGELIEV